MCLFIYLYSDGIGVLATSFRPSF